MENNWRNSHKGFKTFTNINAWRFIHYASVTFIYSIHTFQPHSQIHNEHTPTRKHRHTDLPSKVLYRKRRFNSVVKTHSPWFRASLFLTLFFFVDISFEYRIVKLWYKYYYGRSHTKKKIINVLLSLSPRWTRRVIYVKYLQEIIVNYEKSSFVFPRWYFFFHLLLIVLLLLKWDFDLRYSENPLVL